MNNEVHFETLSSNSLFHFTQNLEWLKGIISKGFIPRYSLEDLRIFLNTFGETLGEDYNVGVPMVCFCDIPLSKIKNHISWYGGYGIGIDKEWGMEQGICPVIYFDNKRGLSETSKNLTIALDNAWKSEIPNEENFDTTSILKRVKPLNRLCLFYKPYEGRFEHHEKVDQRKRFYDEREWRYVPNLYDIDINNKADMPDQYLRNHSNYILQRDKNNKLLGDLSAFHLPIIPDYVKYIIVRETELDKNKEVLEMMRHIDDVFGSLPYSKNSIDVLKSKIVTLEQIKDDF